MIKITKDSFNAEIEKFDGVCVVDLYADWCGPCKMMAPVLEELEEEMQNVRFAKINVDEERELAQMFKVQSIPMIAIVKDGVFVDYSVGFKPKDDIKDFIESCI